MSKTTQQNLWIYARLSWRPWCAGDQVDCIVSGIVLKSSKTETGAAAAVIDGNDANVAGLLGASGGGRKFSRCSSCLSCLYFWFCSTCYEQLRDHHSPIPLGMTFCLLKSWAEITVLWIMSDTNENNHLLLQSFSVTNALTVLIQRLNMLNASRIIL